MNDGGFTRFTPETLKKSDEANVKEKEWFSQVINVVLNYWEIKPTQYEARLHDLALKNVDQVSAFVPWSHVETDIYHSLMKFLKAAAAVKLRVRLFVMPELGVNYPNSGVPKELLGSISNLAVNRIGQVIYSSSAPNIFPLPSFSSQDVLKRFGSYLIKVGSILKEVIDETEDKDFCEVVVSNSIFNYYRSHGQKSFDTGDYSAANVIAFRDFIDREYQSEHFKMQLYDDLNRHKFHTYVENLLREKTNMVLIRKSNLRRITHLDVLNPECAPEFSYQSVLSELLDYKPSVEEYYQRIQASGLRNESIFLGNSGLFRKFSDKERSFLMLASVIHSGQVSILEDELFRLSEKFQNKLRTLIRFLGENQFIRQTQVKYISGSKFSMEKKSFGALQKMIPGDLSVGTQINQSRHIAQRLVFCDPKSVIRQVDLLQYLQLARVGKVVVIPGPMQEVPNYEKEALRDFDRFKIGESPLRLNMGLPYEVYPCQLGHVVFYDPKDFWRTDMEIPAENLHQFLQAMLGLADVQSVCSVSDQRIQLAFFVSEEEPGKRLLFLVNPEAESIETVLGFKDNVKVNGLGDAEGVLVGKSFELKVPARGVLSLQVAVPSQTEPERVWN